MKESIFKEKLKDLESERVAVLLTEPKSIIEGTIFARRKELILDDGSVYKLHFDQVEVIAKRAPRFVLKVITRYKRELDAWKDERDGVRGFDVHTEYARTPEGAGAKFDNAKLYFDRLGGLDCLREFKLYDNGKLIRKTFQEYDEHEHKIVDIDLL